MVLVTLAACGGGIELSEDTPDLRDDPSLLHSYSLFLSESALSPEEQVLLANAESVLIEGCMAERGFEIRQPRFGPDVAGGNDPTIGLEKWLFDDTAVAETSGYGIADARAKMEQRLGGLDSESSRQASVELSPAAQLALVGSPEEMIRVTMSDGASMVESRDGCVTKARDQLYGDTELRMRLFLLRQSYRLAFWERLPSEPLVADALARWASCMKDNGFEVRDPGEARSLAAGREGTSGEVFAFEIGIAIADAQCNRTAELASVVGRITPILLEELATEEASAITEMEAMLNSALIEARVVLDAG